MRKHCNGGITHRGSHSIQYDFMFHGIRYRPSLKRTSTEANLRRAREHLVAIKERVAAGSFQFDEEFPALRVAFEFGFRDHPQHYNPASGALGRLSPVRRESPKRSKEVIDL